MVHKRLGFSCIYLLSSTKIHVGKKRVKPLIKEKTSDGLVSAQGVHRLCTLWSTSYNVGSVSGLRKQPQGKTKCAFT